MAKPNWSAIKAEYIAGGISQRKLAAKYGITYPTLRSRAEADHWKEERDNQERRNLAEASQKVASAVATNAAKLEKAKGLAIDRLIKALEQMPESSGSHSRQSVQSGSKRMTVDYDLYEIVSALEKLERSDNVAQGEAVTIVWGRQ